MYFLLKTDNYKNEQNENPEFINLISNDIKKVADFIKDFFFKRYKAFSINKISNFKRLFR